MDNNISKIRELLDNHPEDEKVVLQDLIDSLVGMTSNLAKLEIHNYKDSINSSISAVLKHEKLVKEFKYRLRNEVKPEVVIYHTTKPRKKHPGNIKNLAWYKERNK